MDTYNKFIYILQELFKNELVYENVNIDINENEIDEYINLAIQNKLFTPIIQLLKCKFPENKKIELLSQKHNKYTRKTIETISKVVGVITEKNLPYCIIKGVPLSLSIYDDPGFRGSRDIDVILEEKDWKEVYDSLRECGYSQVDNEGADEPLVYFSDAYFEVKLVNKKLRDYPAIELKCGSSAFGRQEIGWFDHTKRIQIGECEIVTQDDSYALVHMFANVFSDNEDRMIYKGNVLRHYFDIAYYLEYKLNSSIDEVIKTADELQCSRKMLSVLRSVAELFDFKKFDIQRALKKTKEKSLNFPRVMPRFTQKDDYMGGSRIPNNIIRNDSVFRMKNRDYAFAEYVRNHKQSVFSNINKGYLSRQILERDEKTEWIEYDTYKGIRYRYINGDTDVFVECKIPFDINEKLKNNFFVKFILINSNYFVPTLYEDVNCMIKDSEISEQKIVFSKEDDYSDEFMDEYKDLFLKTNVFCSSVKSDGEFIYTFRIDKKNVLVEHNSVLFEFGLARALKNGYSTNMAAKQEIVEFK